MARRAPAGLILDTESKGPLMALLIEQFTCRSDNFGVLVHDEASGETASIDAPEAAPILDALERRGWSLTHILCTHHHADHVDGNAELIERTGATLVGPEAEAARIEGLDRTVADGEAVALCGTQAVAIAVPGHTAGQIAWHWPDDGLLFAADCLFSLGCGRVFEGTMDEMHHSLRRLAALPKETRVYCGHEYTLSNARFALTVEPNNEALRRRAAEVEALRDRGGPTLPVTLADELDTNPFLRTGEMAVRRAVGMDMDASDAEVFGALRRLKDKS